MATKKKVYRAPFSEPYTITPVKPKENKPKVAKVVPVNPLVEILALTNPAGGLPSTREALAKIAKICKEHLPQ